MLLVQITEDRIEVVGGTTSQDIVDPTSMLPAFQEVVKRDECLVVVALAAETAVDSRASERACCGRGHRSSRRARQ